LCSSPRAAQGLDLPLIELPVLVTPSHWLEKAKNWLAQALPQWVAAAKRSIASREGDLPRQPA
jgi:hypothetical protein